MTSSNRNISALLALCAKNSPVTFEFPTQSDAELSLICAWINGWVNNGAAGDLRRHRAHYDIIVKVGQTGYSEKTQFAGIAWRHLWRQPYERMQKHCISTKPLLYFFKHNIFTFLSFLIPEMAQEFDILPRGSSQCSRPLSCVFTWWRHQMETFSA